MRKHKISRRRFMATTAAASATMMAAPFVRTANAAGKTLDRLLGPLGARRQQRHQGPDRGMGRKGEGRGLRSTTSPRRATRTCITIAAEAQAQVGSRHPRIPDLVAAGARRAARAGRRRHERSHQGARQGQRHGRVPRQDQRQMARRAGHRRQPDQGAVLAHRPDEVAGRHRRAGDVSGRRRRPRPTTGRSRRSSRRRRPATRAASRSASASARTTDSVDTAGAFFHAHGAMLVDDKGNITVKSDKVRQALEYLKKLAQFLPARRAGLGRCLQQQVAGGRQRRADHEPAERLGRRQARRAADRRAVLDARLPVGPERSLCAVPALLLGHLELQQEQVGGQEPAAASVDARRRPRRWWRRAPATTCPRSRSSPTSRPGPRKGRPRARSITIPTRTTIRCCRSPRRRLRRRSRIQIYMQAVQTKMVVRYPAGRDRWRRRSPGPRASAKASCAPEGTGQARDAAAVPIGGRAAANAQQTAGAWESTMVDAVLQGVEVQVAPAAQASVEPAQGHAAQVDHRLPDGAAADPADRPAGHLSGDLLDASGDAQQVDAALRRARQLLLPVQARDLLDGGAAVLHLRDHRRDLQGADRLHRRPFRAQHPGQGPAQVARHAAGAVGDPAGHELSRLAVAVRPVLQRLQLGARASSASGPSPGPAMPTGRASR